MTREQCKKKSSDERKERTYANYMFLAPGKVKNPERVIEKIRVLSRKKNKNNYMCVVHMDVGGRRKSYTRHLPFDVLDAIVTKTKVNVEGYV